jgi:hypothetical protein
MAISCHDWVVHRLEGDLNGVVSTRLAMLHASHCIPCQPNDQESPAAYG